MTPELAALLRAPFAPELVGKLPRVWCGACRESRTKVCERHTKTRCTACDNKITEAHRHLDYVGHAETTDRLLQVDPEWTWEPFAIDSNGLPFIDQHGGLWIRLTVAGMTRLGYGHAEGKKGPDAVKETIGDAIRNASMRFGVALDLWGAKFKEESEPEGEARSTYPDLLARVDAAASDGDLKATWDALQADHGWGLVTAEQANEITALIKAKREAEGWA